MTELLQQVVEEIAQLSDDEQNAFANRMLEELEIRKKTGAKFERQESILDKFSYWMLEANKHRNAITLDLSQS